MVTVAGVSGRALVVMLSRERQCMRFIESRWQMREGLDVSLHGEYAYDDDAVKNAKKALLGELKKCASSRLNSPSHLSSAMISPRPLANRPTPSCSAS
jgi:hypothetical protein